VTNLLLDTDILINWLRGQNWERELLLRPATRFYYSVITKKELLSKKGLSNSEMKKIEILLHWLRKVPIDPTIAHRSFVLHQKYKHRRITPGDAIIAATAWAKNFTLITRNKKHFDFIQEIRVNKQSAE